MQIMLLGLMVSLGGCALTPQQVKFAPTVAPSSRTGPVNADQKQIVLVSADERTSTSIGNRGLGVGMSAEITTNDDLASVVESQMKAALGARGFAVVTGPNRNLHELRIEVRNVQYQVTPGIVTGHLRAEAALKGICSFAGERRYEHLYRGESTEEVFLVQFAESNTKHLNTALSAAMSNIVADNSLMSCLTE
ncbi:MAG: hypothetical protein IT492_23585 [Gammaproteobacteria bacterium]|nr:hypothetical protein [Gammaproteobacteria bacterium]